MSRPAIVDLVCPCECLTPGAGHYFYGYYDNPAWSGDGRFHLCHRVNFWDRIPTPADAAEIGMIRLEDRRFISLSETTAWNFQQGSMLQWHPKAPDDQIIYNRFVDGRFAGAIRSIRNGEERVLSRPVANVDPTGRYALSINFGRLFDFRPGYGYPHIADPLGAVDQPEDDGVWRVDLESGASKLIVSLKAIAGIEPEVTRGRKILINHITFNTDGTRFVFLARTFPKDKGGGWKTCIYTSDLAGRVFPLRPFAYASHYNWRDPKRVLFFSGTETDKALRLLTDLSREEQLVDPAFFTLDGHCNYSPNRKWLTYDMYAAEGYRALHLYDLVKRKGMTLGRFRSGGHDFRDYRSDLHCRWNRAGTKVSFDSTHDEGRRVYELDVSGIVQRA